MKYLSPGLQATLVMGEPRRGRNCLLWVSSCHSTRTDSSPPERRYVPGWGVEEGGWESEWRRMEGEKEEDKKNEKRGEKEGEEVKQENGGRAGKGKDEREVGYQTHHLL